MRQEVNELMEVMEVGGSREGGSDVGVDENFIGSKAVSPRISERLQRLEQGYGLIDLQVTMR